MAFQGLSTFKYSLQASRISRLLNHDNSLWCDLVTTKYGSINLWFPPNLKNTSWNWRLFIQELIAFHPGFFKQIGNGFQTDAYNNPWLVDLPLYLKPTFINVSSLHMNKSVSLI